MAQFSLLREASLLLATPGVYLKSIGGVFLQDLIVGLLSLDRLLSFFVGSALVSFLQLEGLVP